MIGPVRIYPNREALMHEELVKVQKWVAAKVTHRWMRNLELGTISEWVSIGVGYSMGVGWVGKNRYE